MDRLRVNFIQDLGDGNLQSEALWCKIIEGGYLVENIPFVAKRVSLGNRIKSAFDEDDT